MADQKRGFLYVAEQKDSETSKIGFTNRTIKQREEELNQGLAPFQKIVKWIETPHYRAWETEIKNIFKQYAIKGTTEWFSFQPDRLVRLLDLIEREQGVAVNSKAETGNSPAPSQAPKQKARRELTEGQEQVLRLKKDGMTYRQIAKELGISVGTVSTRIRALKKKGRLGNSPAPSPQAPKQKARRELERELGQVRRYKRKGMKNGEIAKRLNLRSRTVSTRIRELVRRLRVKGMKYKDIADDLNLPLGGVGNHIMKLKENGELEAKPKSWVDELEW